MGIIEGFGGNKHRWKAVLVSLGLLIAGCHQPVQPAPSVTQSPVAIETTVAATPTPMSTQSPSMDGHLVAFQAVTKEFEAPIPEDTDGYSLVEPLLSGKLPGQDEGSVYDLTLDTVQAQQAFDQNILPLLQKSFASATFVPNRELVVGDAGVDYRGLRHLVGLVGQRADQHWAAGNKDSALELASLPIALAKAMQARPETASVNLFSLGYAGTTIDLIPHWLESGKSDSKVVVRLRDILKASSPNYRHLQQTVTVDFAQLLNSLDSDDGRSRLGIGLVEAPTLTRWKKQIVVLFEEAQKLYLPDGGNVEAFNEAFRAASEPIQGVVIPYPEVATSQKHSFLRFKAAELGLLLLSEGGDKVPQLELETVIGKLAVKDEATANVLRENLDLELTETSIRILGKQEKFSLISPQQAPVLFEYHRDLGKVDS